MSGAIPVGFGFLLFGGFGEINGARTSPVQHILAELERVYLPIRVQVCPARQVQAADEQFQKLYISALPKIRGLLTHRRTIASRTVPYPNEPE